MYRKIRCPVLVIHGDNDQIQPYARAQAVRRGERLRSSSRSKAAATTRSVAIPAKCNTLINDFLDRRLGIAGAQARG